MERVWSNKRVFLLATIGSAIGLGNFWRFPFITGENGGGAFVIVYAICVMLLGIPMIMVELSIGRLGGHNPVRTMQMLTKGVRGAPVWRTIGWLSVITPMLAITTYGVVAGWAFDYAYIIASGSQHIIDTTSSQNTFDSLISNPLRMYGSFSLFIFITVLVVAGGLKKGLERAIKVIMPMLFLLILVLLVYTAYTADFMQGLNFMFEPDFSKLNNTVVLTALGQAFFSLSIGMGATLVYGSYVPSDVSIPKSAFIIASVDSLIAIIAGLIVFPLVFSYGLEIGQGPSLVFVTLPIAFGQMPGGQLIGALFFMMFAITGLTTAFALLEPGVSWLVEKTKLGRPRVAMVLGLISWIGGIFVVLSFNKLAEYRPLSFIPLFNDKGIFDIIDFIISNILLPLCGLLLSLFAGWVLSHQVIRKQLNLKHENLFLVWRLITRYIAPLAIFWLFVEQFL